MGNKRGSVHKRPKQPPKVGGVLAGPRKFTRDVRSELRRVSWPNRDQLRQSTAVVLIIVLVLAAYVAAWDFVFSRLARLIFL